MTILLLACLNNDPEIRPNMGPKCNPVGGEPPNIGPKCNPVGGEPLISSVLTEEGEANKLQGAAVSAKLAQS